MVEMEGETEVVFVCVNVMLEHHFLGLHFYGRKNRALRFNLSSQIIKDYSTIFFPPHFLKALHVLHKKDYIFSTHRGPSSVLLFYIACFFPLWTGSSYEYTEEHITREHIHTDHVVNMDDNPESVCVWP